MKRKAPEPKKRNEFYTDKLAALAGFTIVGAVTDTEGEFFGLQLRAPSGILSTLWLLSDDEGNGPGSFELQS
jgi:hypothetical protein